MNTVRQLLQLKGNFTWTVQAEAPADEALRLMAEKDVSALPVLDGQNLVGIVTERDYSRKTFLKNRTSRKLAVSKVMTTVRPEVHPDQTVEECLEVMTRSCVRHLLVVEAGRLVGVVTMGDLMRDIIYSQRKKLSALESPSQHLIMV